jgi:uncharacterized membrane protein
MLKQISLGNMIVRRTKQQFNVLFGLLITCYIIRVIFEILLLTDVYSTVVGENNLFKKMLLQDIFYLIWDLPALIPVLCLHYTQFKPRQ